MKKLLTIILGFFLVGTPVAARANDVSFQTCGYALETGVLATTAGIGGGIAGCLVGGWTADIISTLRGLNKKERFTPMIIGRISGLCLCPIPVAASILYKRWAGIGLHPVEQASCVIGALGLAVLGATCLTPQKSTPKDKKEKMSEKK